MWCQLHGGNKSSVRLRTDGRSVSKAMSIGCCFRNVCCESVVTEVSIIQRGCNFQGGS